MIEDDILREIRQIREAFAAEHNYDIPAMAETLRKMELPSGTPIVTYRAKTVAKVAPNGSPTDIEPSIQGVTS